MHGEDKISYLDTESNPFKGASNNAIEILPNVGFSRDEEINSDNEKL